MNLYVTVIFSVLILGANSAYSRNYVEEIFKWKSISFDNLPRPENSYVGPYRYYIPENFDMSCMSYHPATGLMVVNLIRLRPGVPATLAAFCVSDYSTGSSPKVWGFPNYEVNALRASDFTQDAGRSYQRKHNKYSQSSNYYNHYNGQHSYHNYHGGHNNYHGGHNNYHGGHNNYHGGHNNYHGSHGYHHYNHYIYQKPFYPSPVTPPEAKKPADDFRIVSTYYSFMDERCNRLFTIDVGVLDYYFNDSRIIQKPVLLVYDILPDCCQTRKFPLSRRAVIPDEATGSKPFTLFFLRLDYQSDDCNDLFVYITGPLAGYVITYDYKNDEFWYFTGHPSFQPVIAESHYSFNRTFEYDLPMGIGGLTLGYEDADGDRTAYYFPISSTAQYAVSTSVLKNKQKSPDNYNPDDFTIMGYRGCNTQATNLAVDYTYGVVFYLEFNSHRVSCWNMKKPLNPDNVGVIFESIDKLPFMLQIFVDSRGYLWFNSCQVVSFFLNNQPVNLQQVNDRIFRVKVSDAIRGTVCEDEDDFRIADLYDYK